jgi:hypothetical protein
MARRGGKRKQEVSESEASERTSESPVPGAGGDEQVEAMNAEASERDDERLARTDYADAFIPDPSDNNGASVFGDDLAEALGEEFVLAATTGEETVDQDLQDVVPEEIGGPFVETSAEDEYATEPDSMNPEDGTREPLPRGVHALTQNPEE